MSVAVSDWGVLVTKVSIAALRTMLPGGDKAVTTIITCAVFVPATIVTVVVPIATGVTVNSPATAPGATVATAVLALVALKVPL